MNASYLFKTMAQISGAKVRIFESVAFPICSCPQLPGCCAEQFTLLDISTASCGTSANVVSKKKETEREKERLKLKTYKIKNKTPKSPGKKY